MFHRNNWELLKTSSIKFTKFRRLSKEELRKTTDFFSQSDVTDNAKKQRKTTLTVQTYIHVDKLKDWQTMLEQN
jgi:hypothetical protein